MPRQYLLLLAALALGGCAILDDLSGGGGEALTDPMIWRCEGGASFRAQILGNENARIAAAGRTYTLPRTGPGARFAGSGVTYVERAGQATLEGARGGPYRNCRR